MRESDSDVLEPDGRDVIRGDRYLAGDIHTVIAAHDLVTAMLGSHRIGVNGIPARGGACWMATTERCATA